MATLFIDTKLNHNGTVEVKKLRGEVDSLGNSSQKTHTSLAGMAVKVASLTVVAYAASRAVKALVTSGYEYNNSIEQSIQGLTALTVATSSNIDSLGNSINIQQKYALANKESFKTMKELEAINAQTPHTLNETNKIYKAMYVSMKKVGATNKEMISLTKQISIAAGAAGIEFNSLLAGVDGLASGTVLANSDLGRFLSGLGLTNDALKNTKDVVGLLDSKLRDFKGADTMDVAVSNLTNTWQQMTGEITESSFDGAKIGLNELSGIIKNLDKEDIKALQEQFDNFATAGVASVGFLTKAFIGLQSTVTTAGTAMADVMLWLTEWDGDYEEMSKSLWETQMKALAANQKIVDGINKAVNKTIAGVKEAKKEASELEKASSGNLTNKSTFDATESAKKVNNIFKIMNAQTVHRIKLEEAAAKATLQYNQELQKNHKLYISIVGTDYDKWLLSTNNKLLELQKTGFITNEQIRDLFTTLQQNHNTELTMTGLDEATNGMTDMIDSQIELISSTNDWKNGLTGVAAAIGGVSTAFSKMTVDNLTATKAQLKLDRKHEVDKKKYAKDSTKLHLVEQIYQKNTTKIKKASTKNELDAYSNLAGAASGFFKESSAGYKVLNGLQIALQLAIQATALSESSAAATSVAASTAAAGAAMTEAGANATASVTAAGKGDPYTAAARVVAMMALMASAMTMFTGGSGGGGATQPEAPLTVGDVSGGSLGTLFEGTNSYSTLEDAIKELNSTIDVQNKLFTASGLYGTKFLNDKKVSSANLVTDTLEAWREVFKRTDNVDVSGSMAGFDVKSLSVWEQNTTNVLKTFGDDYLGFVNSIAHFDETYVNTFLNARGQNLQNIEKVMTEAKMAINTYSLDMLDLAEAMTDYRKTWIDIFEEHTKKNTYTLQAQKAATTKVNTLKTSIGVNSYADLLESLINKYNIDYTKAQELFKQGDMYNLAIELNNLFPKGSFDPQEVYDYVDAIESVGKMMIDSKNNIDSWNQRNETASDTAVRLAKQVGVNLATSMGGLDSMASKLIASNNALSSSELELLGANEEYIKFINETAIDGLNKTLETTSASINTLEGTLSSLTGIIDKLRDSTLGSSYSIGRYNNSMSETLALAGTDNAKDFQKSLSYTISSSDALFKPENFATQNDMLFAQAVAANQFDSMEVKTATQIDYLKEIAETVKKQLAVFDGTDFSSIIQGIYQSELGRSANAGELDYYTNDFNNGQSVADVTNTISNSDENFIRGLYETSGAIKDMSYTAAGVTGLEYWMNDLSAGDISRNEVTDIFKNVYGFSNGGYTGDSLGVVHPKEYVLNAETSSQLGLNNSSSTGVFAQMVKKMDKFIEKIEQQNELIAAQANEIRAMRKETEEQSITLINIEEQTA